MLRAVGLQSWIQVRILKNTILFCMLILACLMQICCTRGWGGGGREGGGSRFAHKRVKRGRRCDKTNTVSRCLL